MRASLCEMYLLPMSITALRTWELTPVEVALDLAPPRLSDARGLVFSGLAEPRIRLAAGLALTSHLKRIASAVDRAAPDRAPAKIRISAYPTGSASCPYAICIGPMRSLLALQSKVVRAVEPGLAHSGSVVNFVMRQAMEDGTLSFVRDFIGNKTPPAFEPHQVATHFDSIDLRIVGLTIYALDAEASPEQIIAHWNYPR